MSAFFDILIGGVFHAAVLFLVAAGLQLVFGVQKIVNLACGSFYALGAYFGISAVNWAIGAGMPPALFLPVLAHVTESDGWRHSHRSIEPSRLRREPVWRRGPRVTKCAWLWFRLDFCRPRLVSNRFVRLVIPQITALFFSGVGAFAFSDLHSLTS